MGEDDNDVIVRPWFSEEEWIKVAQHVIIGTDQRLIKAHFQDDEGLGQIDTTDQVEAFRRAVEQITIWKARTHKLAAGVETTFCLLQGAISYAKSLKEQDISSESSVCLCLAASVNRFLNLICHTGFNLFGLTKYYDVAEHFGIPDWIVEVRHETAHGHMPSEELLLDALAFSLKWIALNYWIPELKNCTYMTVNEAPNEDNNQDSYLKSIPIYKRIHNLLDCYRYLKLYTIWGGVSKVSDLKDQSELYDHIIELLGIILFKKAQFEDGKNKSSYGEILTSKTDNKMSRSNKRRKKSYSNNGSSNVILTELNDLKIGTAMNLIRDKIHSVICSVNNGQIVDNCCSIDCEKALVLNLLQEEFILPNRDFFDSLFEHEESCETSSTTSNLWSTDSLLENFNSFSINSQSKPLKLPKNLVLLWTDILQMMANYGPESLLSELLYGLHEVSGGRHLTNTSGDDIILSRSLASAWVLEVCNSLSANIPGYKKSQKEIKNKKNIKTPQKDKLKENNGVPSTLKLTNVNIESQIFQNSFCRQVIMNPLTEMVFGHLSSVLSLVLIRSSSFDGSNNDMLLSPIDEKEKLKIVQLICALFGIKGKEHKSSAAILNATEENVSIQTVDSLSKYVIKASKDRAKIGSNDSVSDMRQEDDAMPMENQMVPIANQTVC